MAAGLAARAPWLAVVLASAGGFALAAAVLAWPARGRRPPAGKALDAAPGGPAPMADPLTSGAALAHELSSPLAALKSNLEWLRDALEDGRLRAPDEEAELREVLRDAHEAADRLGANLGALRASSRRNGGSLHS